MIDCILMKNASPVEKIGKNLSGNTTFQCVLKDKTSILHPTLRINTSDNIYTFNYLKIPDFGRYYFIDDIVSQSAGIWEITAHVDVLETYKTAILSNDAVVRRQQNRFNLYLNDPDFNTYNYDRLHTEKLTAQGGFNKALNYILVVNGA